MITKPDKMETYNEGNSSIVSHDPVTEWSREVTWEIKDKISSLKQGRWRPNLAEW